MRGMTQREMNRMTQREVETLLNVKLRRVAKAIRAYRRRMRGTVVTILEGPYKGRKGEIDGVLADERLGLMYIVRPYNLRTGELMWEQVPARTYHERSYFRIDRGQE